VLYGPSVILNSYFNVRLNKAPCFLEITIAESIGFFVLVSGFIKDADFFEDVKGFEFVEMPVDSWSAGGKLCCDIVNEPGFFWESKKEVHKEFVGK